MTSLYISIFCNCTVRFIITIHIPGGTPSKFFIARSYDHICLIGSLKLYDITIRLFIAPGHVEIETHSLFVINLRIISINHLHDNDFIKHTDPTVANKRDW